jgi:hypothetical protein
MGFLVSWMHFLATTIFTCIKLTRKDYVHHKPRLVLLQGHAILSEEWWGHLSKAGEIDVLRPDWKNMEVYVDE